MDSEPKTRREQKKTAKEKAGPQYSGKHVRQVEANQHRAAAHKPKHTQQNTK